MRYKGLIVPGLFWAATAYNMAVVTFTTGNIIGSLGVDKFWTGMLVSITLIGWFFGSFIFGYLSDKFGRRKIVLMATPIHVIATALMFFAFNYWIYFVLRFIAGMGFGIILPILSALVSENASPEIRGRLVVLLDSFWTYGWVAASFVAYLLLPRLGDYWKYYYLIALIWLLPLLLWKYLPESGFISKKRKVDISSILKNPSTYALWILWFAMAFGYYGMFVWLPKIFSENYPVLKSTEFIFLTYLFQIPGYFTAAYLIEKIGRKPVLFIFMFITALSSYIFITSAAILGAILISFFDMGAWGAIYAYTPELYTDNVRGTGAGFANSAGRIGGIIGPLIPGFFASWFEPFIIYTLVMLLASFLTFALPETMKKVKRSSP
jgi:putative MFS transporter